MKTSQLFPHSTYIPFRSSAGHSTEPPFLFFRIFRTPSAKTLFCFFRMARNMAFFVGSQLGLVIRPPGAWAFLPWVYIVNCFEFTIGRHRKASDRTEGNWKHWKASEGIGPNGRQLEALEGIGRHRIERKAIGSIGRHRKASDRTEGNWKHWKASEGIGSNGGRINKVLTFSTAKQQI